MLRRAIDPHEIYDRRTITEIRKSMRLHPGTNLMIRLFVSILAFSVLLALPFSGIAPRPASAHFFGGSTKDVGDGYQITFVPSPSTPVAGSNNTRLNFSVLKEGQNINNLYVAFAIKDKESGMIIEQFPFKWYEFSDITIPYTFQKPSNYVVTVQTRVGADGEDPSSQSRLFVVDFDLRVKDPSDILSDNPPLVGGIGVGVAIAAIASVLYLKKIRSIKKKISK